MNLNGIFSLLVGALLMGIALVAGFVQLVSVAGDRKLSRFAPRALGATAVALLAGAFLWFGVSFDLVNRRELDQLAIPLFAAALWWVFHNRLGSKRNKLAATTPPAPPPEPPTPA